MLGYSHGIFLNSGTTCHQCGKEIPQSLGNCSDMCDKVQTIHCNTTMYGKCGKSQISIVNTESFLQTDSHEMECKRIQCMCAQAQSFIIWEGRVKINLLGPMPLCNSIQRNEALLKFSLSDCKYKIKQFNSISHISPNTSDYYMKIAILNELHLLLLSGILCAPARNVSFV